MGFNEVNRYYGQLCEIARAGGSGRSGRELWTLAKAIDAMSYDAMSNAEQFAIEQAFETLRREMGSYGLRLSEAQLWQMAKEVVQQQALRARSRESPAVKSMSEAVDRDLSALTDRDLEVRRNTRRVEQLDDFEKDARGLPIGAADEVYATAYDGKFYVRRRGAWQEVEAPVLARQDAIVVRTEDGQLVKLAGSPTTGWAVVPASGDTVKARAIKQVPERELPEKPQRRFAKDDEHV